jgi:hypothetical protein
MVGERPVELVLVCLLAAAAVSLTPLATSTPPAPTARLEVPVRGRTTGPPPPGFAGGAAHAAAVVSQHRTAAAAAVANLPAGATITELAALITARVNAQRTTATAPAAPTGATADGGPDAATGVTGEELTRFEALTDWVAAHGGYVSDKLTVARVHSGDDDDDDDDDAHPSTAGSAPSQTSTGSNCGRLGLWTRSYMTHDESYVCAPYPVALSMTTLNISGLCEACFALADAFDSVFGGFSSARAAHAHRDLAMAIEQDDDEEEAAPATPTAAPTATAAPPAPVRPLLHPTSAGSSSGGLINDVDASSLVIGLFIARSKFHAAAYWPATGRGSIPDEPIVMVPASDTLPYHRTFWAPLMESLPDAPDECVNGATLALFPRLLDLLDGSPSYVRFRCHSLSDCRGSV